ncbi:MAG: MFS transporter [Candidatus Bathyarchaeota archaeon]|nr:MFS transporter [Candidatus Bathyarchaeota archaeon]
MSLLSGIRQYIQRMRMLSRNAKLYLVATILQGLSFGIWGVIFYLYLNLSEVGFQPDFISNMFTVGAIATGFVALPAGLICERIGPKKALLVGLTANLISFVQIVALQPSILLFASLASGLIGTLGWVASSPFMMENSKQEERTYLFSINWSLMIIMGVIGSYVGGILPDLFNGLLNLNTGAEGVAVGYRISLVISVALSLAAVVPILLIKESKMLQRQNIGELMSLRNIQSHWTILKFMIPTALIGFGAGFIVPLFTLFFSLKFSATTEQIGIISALSNVTLGVGTLVAPALSSKWGKVKSIVICQYLSMPFIMLITLSPNLALASTAYISRTALMNMAGPINSTLQMESVTEGERGTTNGLMVMADNIPRAVTASISGEMMTGSDFYTPFLFTTVTYFIASSLYFIFFRKAEAKIAST